MTECFERFISSVSLRRSESDEGLMLKTSASESLYGGQFTLSTQLIELMQNTTTFRDLLLCKET